MFSARLAREREEMLALAAAPPVPGAAVTPLDPGETARLWGPGLLEPALRSAAAAVRATRYGGDVFAIAPLYASSICSEQCLYCNFRGGNKGVGVERRRLTDSEVERETEFLVDRKRLRVVELVYAADPLMRADVIARHVGVVRKVLDRHGGGLVGLNAESFETAEYRRLKEAGLDFILLWQETYDPGRYRSLHPGATRKADMAFRLDAPERMLAAGLTRIGLGVLSGLAPWREDWAMLMRHEAYLARERGVAPVVLGIPRLKPAEGAPLRATDHVPSDEEYLAAVALHALFAPATRPFVSTREPWDLCVELATGGGCLFTFNCSTTPGGYALGGAGEQFPVNSYDVDTFVPALAARGLKPAFAWTFDRTAAA